MNFGEQPTTPSSDEPARGREREEADSDAQELLDALRRGAPSAANQLFTHLYPQLRAIAHSVLSPGRSSHTLQPTALVHEAWMRLLGGDGQSGRSDAWKDNEHFLRAAAVAIRHALIDHERTRGREKRGGSVSRISLEHGGGDTAMSFVDGTVDLLAIHGALVNLARIDPKQAEIVELRFFGGVSFETIASMLGVSQRTVEREWKLARTWLQHALKAEGNQR